MEYIVYIDGASKGNPGLSSAGVVIQNEKGETIKEYSHFLGDKLTNNEAEYGAVIFALKKLKLLIGKTKTKEAEITFRADSKLLVEQLEGRFKLNHPNTQRLFIEVWNLKTEFKKIEFFHISREQNSRADTLANQAIPAGSRRLI